MSKRILKKVSVLCLALLLFVSLCGFIRPTVAHAGLMDILNYKTVTIYVDGIRTPAEAYLLSSETYMPVREFCGMLEIEYQELEPEESGAPALQLAGEAINVAETDDYVELNGRCFYLPNGLKIVNGEPCLPLVMLSKMVHAEAVWDELSGSVDVDTSDMQLPVAGEEIYNEEDLYWLSRIINSESGNQNIAGMIGVGNVVMNRALSEQFPDTIKEVVFDRTYGVQFSPVENGGIYAEPSELAVTAAKMCLEGYSVAEDSIYFVNPGVGCSEWFRSTRTFIATIGDHDFYA